MPREGVHWPGAFSLPWAVIWNKGKHVSVPIASSVGSCCLGQGLEEAEQELSRLLAVARLTKVSFLNLGDKSSSCLSQFFWYSRFQSRELFVCLFVFKPEIHGSSQGIHGRVQKVPESSEMAHKMLYACAFPWKTVPTSYQILKRILWLALPQSLESLFTMVT